MNNKKLLIIFIIIFFFIVCIFVYKKLNFEEVQANNQNRELILDNSIDWKDDIKQLHEEEERKLKEEINDIKTENYIIKESTDNTILLKYAYVTEKYAKIELSYKLNNNFNSTSKQKETELIRKYNKTIKQLKEEEGDTYIETSDGKRYIPQRTNDGDGGRTVNSTTGIYEWHDTFPLTTKDTTENLILYFTKANNEIVKIELSKEI